MAIFIFPFLLSEIVGIIRTLFCLFGGLKLSRTAGPGSSAPGSMEKINVVLFPATRCNYTTSALSPSNRKIKKNKARRNKITVRTKSRQSWESGRLGDAPLPIRRDGFAARERRGCFGAMRRDGEKDGSDPIWNISSALARHVRNSGLRRGFRRECGRN